MHKSIDLPDCPSTTPVRTWRVTLVRHGSPTIKIQCNGKELAVFLISEGTCDSGRLDIQWERNVAKIEFFDYDTATNFYRNYFGK